jgi:hypothetical protein
VENLIHRLRGYRYHFSAIRTTDTNNDIFTNEIAVTQQYFLPARKIIFNAPNILPDNPAFLISGIQPDTGFDFNTYR